MEKWWIFEGTTLVGPNRHMIPRGTVPKFRSNALCVRFQRCYLIMDSFVIVRGMVLSGFDCHCYTGYKKSIYIWMKRHMGIHARVPYQLLCTCHHMHVWFGHADKMSHRTKLYIMLVCSKFISRKRIFSEEKNKRRSWNFGFDLFQVTWGVKLSYLHWYPFMAFSQNLRFWKLY